VALYGSVEDAKALRSAPGSASFAADPALDARLGRIRAAVSAWIEEKTGRVFGGDAAAPRGRLVLAPGSSPLLLLPEPARSVPSVLAVRSWDGAAWQGEPVPADRWAPHWTGDGGLTPALTTLDGSLWHGPYLVTAEWEGDNAGGGVPPEIDYVATRLIAEVWKHEDASPQGQLGPQGQVIPLRNPFKDTLVLDIIARHAAPSEQTPWF